jgi:hypothetical protein
MSFAVNIDPCVLLAALCTLCAFLLALAGTTAVGSVTLFACVRLCQPRSPGHLPTHINTWTGK